MTLLIKFNFDGNNMRRKIYSVFESILGYVEESKYYRLDDKKAKNDLWILKHDIDALFNSVNHDKDLDMLLLQKCKKLLSQIEAAATEHN